MGAKLSRMGDNERQTESNISDTVDAANDAVARHLRAERARARLSQAELAAAAGLAVNTIRRLEDGTRELKLSQLFAITQVLGVSPGAFLDAAQAAMRK
jgi:transcriptional regulator with XRE-family HTH domain